MSLSTLTPYDTGERFEPKLWQSNREAVLNAMKHDETKHIGKVDFENDSGDAVVEVHVSHNDDGTWTVHVTPFAEEDEIEIELHAESGSRRVHPPEAN